MSEDTILNDTEWAEYQESCAGVQYRLSLAVDFHMYMLAEPISVKNNKTTNDNDNHMREMHHDGQHSKTCGPILFHRGVSGRKEVVQHAMEQDVSATTTTTMKKKQWGILPISSNTDHYSLEQLAKAYDLVEMDDHDDTTGNEYDAVVNNCGDFIKSFAGHLGLIATPEIAIWVSEQLVKYSGEVLVDRILQSNHKDRLLIDDSMTNFEMVHRVVEQRARELYE